MRLWVEATRPRTLPLSIAPVAVGTAVSGEADVLRLIGALGVSVGLQIGVNLANDLFDARKGVDTADRVGPRRLTAAGLVSPQAMKRATAIALSVAAIAGSLLAWVVGVELLLVGLLCILAALGYSGGPRPYASAGLGEVFVFVFFGLVATAGSAYVQVEQVRWAHVAAGVPVGLLACGVMVVNNLRDIESDRMAGKMTLAVRAGPRGTKVLYDGLLVGAFSSLVPLALLARNPWVLLTLPAAALARQAATHLHAGTVRFGDALLATVRLDVVFCGLLTLGLAIG